VQSQFSILHDFLTCEITPWKHTAKLVSTFVAIVEILCLSMPAGTFALAASEVLDEVVKHNFQESFRVVLSIKTDRAKKRVSDHILWLTSRSQKLDTDFFIEFDEPKESKGLRFLIQVRPEKLTAAFMYLPATGKTIPLALDDPSADMGGTGLSMEDIQGFIPKGGESATILKEEKADNHDCYVVKVSLPGEGGERLLWVSKNGFLVVKSQQVDAKGKLKRTFRVAEFFKTEQGREFPREEEITIPDKDTRIRVRQEHSVFGIELPAEIMDPEKFGKFQWRN
jgi:hypothetical protein